jgi:hypothetical protein
MHFRYVRLICLAILPFLFSTAAVCQAPETDFQIWNETVFVKPVLKQRTAKAKTLQGFRCYSL